MPDSLLLAKAITRQYNLRYGVNLFNVLAISFKSSFVVEIKLSKAIMIKLSTR